MTSAIELNGLSKSYGDLVAVDDVTAVAEAGKVTALLGPNGAGKTTTSADAARARRTEHRHRDAGRQAVRRAVRTRSGRSVRSSRPQAATPDGTALDHLRDPGDRGQAVPTTRRARPGRDRAGRGRAAACRGSSPSGCGNGWGWQPRCSATPACSSWTSRPTASTRRACGGCAGTSASSPDEGRTVLLSSHALSEVEQTADHVLVLAHGRLLRSSTLAALRAEAGVGCRVRTPEPDRLCAALDAAGHRLPRTRTRA